MSRRNVTDQQASTVVHFAADATFGHHDVANPADMAWWLPILGPTPTVLLTTITRNLSTVCGASWPLDELAARVGVKPTVARQALDRLQMFHAARWQSLDVMTVRLFLPTLSVRQLARLPEAMQASYPFEVRP